MRRNLIEAVQPLKAANPRRRSIIRVHYPLACQPEQEATSARRATP